MNSQPDPSLGPWLRFLQFPLIRLVFLYYMLLYVYISGYQFLISQTKGPVQALGASAVMVGYLLFVYVGFVHFVERRPASELAVSRLGRELGAGVLLGAGLYTGCVLIAMALGLYRIDGLNDWRGLLSGLWAAPLAPMFEELVFRGALFRIVEEVFGGWIALVVSSMVFGLVHMSNDGESFVGIASIVIVFGPMLAAPFMLTRRLWVGIGLHFGWNFTMGKIFSGSVSGNGASHGLFATTFAGPDLLTGGAAGMEGSLIAILVSAAAGAVMLVLAARRGLIVPPVWARTGEAR